MNAQRGVTLIVALIFLLLISLGGISLLQGAKSQQSIVNTYEEKEISFQAAETALREAEDFVGSTNFTATDFITTCVATLGIDACFNPACTNGLCRTVSFTNTTLVSNCSTNGTRVWETPANWANARPLTVTVNRTDEATPKTVVFNAEFLVEFRCFVPNTSPLTLPVTTASNIEWSEYYRITVRVTGSDNVAGTNARQSPVMLQSTFRKN